MTVLLQTLIDAKYERIAKLQDAVLEMQEDASHLQAMMRSQEANYASQALMLRSWPTWLAALPSTPAYASTSPTLQNAS